MRFKSYETKKSNFSPKKCFCEYTDFDWNCNVNSSEDLCFLGYTNLAHFVFIWNFLTWYCTCFMYCNNMICLNINWTLWLLDCYLRKTCLIFACAMVHAESFIWYKVSYTSVFTLTLLLAYLRWRLKVRYCDRFSVVRPSVVRLCVNFFFKQHLLLNHRSKFHITLHECCSWCPLSKLHKWFRSTEQEGRQSSR